MPILRLSELKFKREEWGQSVITPDLIEAA